MKTTALTAVMILAFAGCTAQSNTTVDKKLYLPKKETITEVCFTKFTDKDVSFTETYETDNTGLLSYLDGLNKAAYYADLENNEFPDTELIVLQITTDQDSEYVYGFYYDEESEKYFLEDYKELSSFVITEEQYQTLDHKFSEH